MTKVPLFIFLARPAEKIRINGIFDGGRVRHLLEHPPTLRYAGWSLETLDQARIVRGEYLEVTLSDQKRIQLYEDGTFLARVKADNEFLGWGTPEAQAAGKKIRINSLALIEFVYLCVEFYRQALAEASPTPTAHSLQVSFRNAKDGDESIYLNPFGVDTLAWMSGDRKYPAPDDSVDRAIDIAHSDLADPARTAYQLVERIYTWFGLPTNEIPYVVEVSGLKSVDVEAIRRGGKVTAI